MNAREQYLLFLELKYYGIEWALEQISILKILKSKFLFGGEKSVDRDITPNIVGTDMKYRKVITICKTCATAIRVNDLSKELELSRIVISGLEKLIGDKNGGHTKEDRET